ncbi:bleomycin resistance protein [Nocardia takedensis]|uniref:bleomycin resistance protein n=1 Tax=Nocardia takedensis TaxID=259390 RepID=UPI0002D5CFC2|nr:VOC family protein [Nocardia takedensis]
MTEKTIPLLRARSIDPVADFYTALGFEITYRQDKPYRFLSVRRGGVELNFHGDRTFEPAASTHGCLVDTDHVDHLYAVFTEALTEVFGAVPTGGIPRVGALKDTTYGVRQFLLIDPGGNTLQIAQRISDDQEHRPAPRSTFERAVHLGALYADSKQDLDAAVRILDRALGRTDERPTPVQLVKLLVLRADVGIRRGEVDLARNLLARVRAARVDGPELVDDLRRAAELEGTV